jgi:hypothetical protein
LLRARGSDSQWTLRPPRATVTVTVGGEVGMLEESQDAEEIIQRVAALDIGKA